MRGRRSAVVSLAVVLVFALSAAALAAFLTSGVGGGLALAASMPAVGTPTAAPVPAGGVSVSWPEATLPGGAEVTYKVRRHNGSTSADVTGCQALAVETCSDDIATPGTYTYYVTAVRSTWRGTESAASNAVTVAQAQPPATPVITDKPDDPAYATTASFDFNSDGADSFECKLDAGAFEPCMTGKTYIDISAGQHTFVVKALNAAGSSTASYTWTAITTAPSAPTLTTAPDDPTNATSATFTFSSANATAYACKLDEGPFTACSSPETYSGLLDGQHTFSVHASNPIGQSSITSHTWTVDTQPAGQPALTQRPANPTNQTDATFEFAKSGGTLPVTFKCKLDAEPNASACTSPKSYSGLGDGSHTFTVIATNINGDSAATTYSWVVDTVAPTITFSNRTAPNGAGWNNTNVTVNWTCTDALSGPVLPAVSQSLTSEGTGLSATGTCTDLAGNTGSDTQSGIKIDKSASSTTDSSATVGNAWRNTDATVTLTPSAAISGAKATYYTTDGSTPTTSSSQGTTVTLTATGTYTIKYFTVDNADNAEPVQTAGTVIRIDKANPSAPSFGSSVPVNNAVLAGNQTWTTAAPADTGGSGAAGIQFEYRVKTNAADSFPATWTPMGSLVVASPWQASLNTALLDKAFLEVRARTVDTAGNSATSARTYTVRPQLRDLQLVNKSGGTAGRMEPGDQLVITYSQAIKTSTGCPSGTTASVVGDNQGGNDRFDMTACKTGQVRLQANYLSANVTFVNTVANWSAGDTVLTITLGSADVANANTNVVVSAPQVTPLAALLSYADIAVDTTGFTAPTTSRF